MLSRVAESIFWMSRYIERAENVSRFIDVNLHLTLDLGEGMPEQWAPLIYTTGDQDDFYERYGDPDQDKVLKYLTFDPENPNSILSCLRSARENARTIREMISSTMWEELNKFYLMVRAASGDARFADAPFDFLNDIRLAGHLLEGITDATMTHNEAWHFGRMGRFMERADKSSRILDVKYYVLLPSVGEVGTPLDTVQWSALLKSASALEMYRKKYGRITPTEVAEFLILDREFPRAIHFCLIQAEEGCLAITGGTPGTFRTPAEQQLGRLRAAFDFTDMGEIIRQGMHEFIDNFQVQLNQVGEAIHRTFFALEPVSLGGGRTDRTTSQRQEQRA